ncbi:MAG TPA: type II secretion system protein GspG [Blastocatellia bacterium]|nr:type II secretion system protein GspG [Blastocatellia bacterium]
MKSVKFISRALPVTCLALLLLWVAAYARQLGTREAREQIASALGLEKSDRVRIKSISPGFGGQATVEASVDAAFRFVQEKDGGWKAVDVRTGDRVWESLELMRAAVLKEKVLRTTADLRTLATALEAFQRERGFYVVADTGRVLVDNLAPRYLGSVIRLDAWSHEFEYLGTATGYRLESRGPDGKRGSGDEIVIENGQLVKGAGE